MVPQFTLSDPCCSHRKSPCSLRYYTRASTSFIRGYVVYHGVAMPSLSHSTSTAAVNVIAMSHPCLCGHIPSGGLAESKVLCSWFCLTPLHRSCSNSHECPFPLQPCQHRKLVNPFTLTIWSLKRLLHHGCSMHWLGHLGTQALARLTTTHQHRWGGKASTCSPLWCTPLAPPARPQLTPSLEGARTQSSLFLLVPHKRKAIVDYPILPVSHQ